MKTVFCLRIRHTDQDPWSDTSYYRRRKERDDCERLNRCMGGFRTHKFEEKKPEEEIAELCD